MLTEVFLNSCFTLVLNDSTQLKKDKAIYRDVLTILAFSEDKKSIEIPAIIQTKFECLKKICEMRLEDRDVNNIIDSLSFSDKYKPMIDFMNMKAFEEVKLASLHDHIRQIRLRKKAYSMFTNYDHLHEFIETMQGGTFDSIDDLMIDYENIIKTLYTTMQKQNRGIAIESSASLDIMKDDYTSVIELIMKKYSKSNAISTGYSIFDEKVFNGGFEPSRIYIFGGSSGAGKSTIMNNFIVNSATRPTHYNNRDDDTTNVYIYITLENTIEEALLRTYMPLFNKTLPQVLAEISDGVDIKKRIATEFEKTNSTVVMKYFPAQSISSLDIMAVLDDVISEYGEDCIKGLYVDYLDLLRADTKYDIYRMELGHITLSLKTLAVEYNIPVITATQLGRSAYRVQNAHELNLDQISESIKKVEHADFVGLLTPDSTDDNIVHIKVGKNRAGKSNLAMDFNVDFSIYKFKNGHIVNNAKRQTNVSESKSQSQDYNKGCKHIPGGKTIDSKEIDKYGPLDFETSKRSKKNPQSKLKVKGMSDF